MRPETSSLWAPLHEQLWKLQVLLSEWLHIDALRLLHQWVILSYKEHKAIKAVQLYECCLVFETMCSDSRTCSLAHCQYGCEEVQGEIRCLCPSPGLQLGQDERTCVGEERGFSVFLFISCLLTFAVGLREDGILTSALRLIFRTNVIWLCLSPWQGLFWVLHFCNY